MSGTVTANDVRRGSEHRGKGRSGPIVSVEPLLPAAIAGSLAVAAILLRWRGSDLPAHFFRVGLVERDGFEVWNNYWFGGHHTLGYGLLFPVLGAAIGIWTVAVISAALSALLADLLIRAAIGHRSWPASLWFAIGTVTNVAIGRLPFALGVTIGLAALLAAQRRWIVPSLVLAALTAAASPVVSAFLVLIFAAWAVASFGRDRMYFAALGGAAIVPVLVISALYPQGGMFPFAVGALAWTLGSCCAVWLIVPRQYRVVRLTAVLYAATSLAAFLVPTPLGANMTRLGMYATAPVLLAVVPRQRIVVAATVGLIAWWQWSPAFDAIVRAGRDPSTEKAYYRPLLDFLDREGVEVVRVEVVPTRRHWEAAYVAVEVPIARGWERQLDRRFNPQLYEPGLTAGVYHRWLRDGGVQYVALSDAPPDGGGEQEAELLASGLPFLRPVFASDHWRVWTLIDSRGLVDGQAEIVSLGIDTVTLNVLRRSDVLVRVHASAFWAAEPHACIESTAEGWILVRDVRPGPLYLFIDETGLAPGSDLCVPAP